VLHKTISAIRAETWEAINRILLDSARQEKVETGKVVRLDSTVTAALMHEPSDSNLLWDAVLGNGAAVEGGRRPDRRPSGVARSSARGEEAGARDRVHPRSTEPGPALP
jgi:IS5 family transposase